MSKKEKYYRYKDKSYTKFYFYSFGLTILAIGLFFYFGDMS